MTGPSPRTARRARRSGAPAQRRRADEDRCLLARQPLPVPGDALPQGQPPAARAAQAGAHQGALARPLGLGRRPGFTYIHLNRLINKYDLNTIFISGPGHGAPAVLSQAYLEGTYSEVYPDKSEDEAGMQRFFKEFSFPGGIGSHCHPRNARLHPRGRRAGLSRLSRLRRGVRQSRPDRRRGGRRRRVRDRPAGHSLALQQVPEPDPRRRGAAGPAPQRLQDQQSDRPRPHHPRGVGGAVRRATATRHTSSRAATPPACTRRWPRRWSTACWRSGKHPGRGRAQPARRSGRAGR